MHLVQEEGRSFRLYQWKPFMWISWPRRGGWLGGGCQLGRKGGARRCCGTEWLIVASRHLCVLVEWIKGWKKEWKPFHAFTDQSQDHVLGPSPRPLVHGTCITLPSTSTSLTSAFARVDVARSNLQTSREENPSSRASHRIPRCATFTGDINVFADFYVSTVLRKRHF